MPWMLSASSFQSVMFCQCFAQFRVTFDPMSDCPRPIHLSKPWLFRCQLFCEALPHLLGHCLNTFKIRLNVYMYWCCYLCVCLARLYGQHFIVPVPGSFMWSPFPVIVFNNIGRSKLNRVPKSEIPLCFVANPCLCLHWKCVLCPTENAKGNLDRAECYTNSNLAKTVEIIQMPVRDYDVSFMLYPQTDI